jgi:hypothetical protein
VKERKRDKKDKERKTKKIKGDGVVVGGRAYRPSNFSLFFLTNSFPSTLWGHKSHWGSNPQGMLRTKIKMKNNTLPFHV